MITLVTAIAVYYLHSIPEEGETATELFYGFFALVAGTVGGMFALGFAALFVTSWIKLYKSGGDSSRS